MKLAESFQPADEQTIAELESQFGFVLPTDFRQLLLTVNGFLLERFSCYFNQPLEFGGEPVWVRHVFGVGPEAEPFTISTRKKSMGGPARLVPVLDDQSANLVCVRFLDDTNHDIVYWDSDTALHEGEHSEVAYEKLADSFGEFWDCLRATE